MKDNIGRDEIANSIISLINDVNNIGHFCVAIDGEWGSGKTFLMDMISEKLQDSSDPNCNYNIVVKYDAWKNNFYSDPLIAILYCVLDELKHIEDKYVKKCTKRIYNRKIKKASVEAVKGTIENGLDVAINVLATSLGEISSIYAAVAIVIKNIIRQVNNSALDNELFKEYKSYQKLLNDCITVFCTLTSKEIKELKYRRLIILVDELDRCLPNEQLLILERLHHLFDVDNCAVVIAMNKTQIVSTFDTNYGKGGKEYLRKFFDYSFHIEMGNDIFFQNQLSDEIMEDKKIICTTPISQEKIKLIQEVSFNLLLEEYKQEDLIDNREIKRIISCIVRVIGKTMKSRIDYTYLFLISYFVCCKMYKKSLFDKIYNKKAETFYNLLDGMTLSGKLVRVCTVSSYFNSGYNFYDCADINMANYYINLWLSDGSKNNRTNTENLFFTNISTKSIDASSMQKLSKIFNEINSISN